MAIAVTMIVLTTALNVSGTKLLASGDVWIVAIAHMPPTLLLPNCWGRWSSGATPLMPARHQDFGVLFYELRAWQQRTFYLPAFLASSVAGYVLITTALKLAA